MRNARTSGFLLIAAFVLAGCAGPAPEAAAVAEPAEAPAPTVETGSVTGRVSNDELLPIHGAQVGLVEPNLVAKTDPQGVFTFNAVDPGEYRLLVDRLGYQSYATMVTVRAGAVTEIAVMLTAIQVEETPWSETLILDGYLQGGLNPYWPTNACGDALGANNARFVHELLPGIKLGEFVYEVVWTPSTSATAQHLELDVCEYLESTGNELNCFDHSAYWAWKSAKSPIVLRVDGGDVPFKEIQVYGNWSAV